MTATTPTYGSLTRNTQGQWELRLTPPVVIKAKRVFAKIATTASGVLTLTATPENARDLEWFITRWPLELDPATQEALTTDADQHRDQEQAVAAILAGERIPTTGLATPALPPRHYQEPVMDLITTMRKVLVTDALGLGKTYEGAATFRNPGALPAVVVCPTHLPTQWEKHINTIWPELRVHIARKATPYDMTRYGGTPDVLILNYAKLRGWGHHIVATPGGLGTVIFDEAQELRRGTDSDKGRTAAFVASNARYSVGLSATPIHNYGGEIWNVLNTINQGCLGKRDEFLREWGGHTVYGLGGDHATIKDPAALAIHLRDTGLMIGRTRHEVGKELPYGEPIKVPHIIDADTTVLNRMAGDAVEMAKLILSRSSNPQQRWRSAGELDLRMRQATGIAKAPYVAAFVKTLLESEERIILFGWHHACYNIWAEQLRPYRPVRFTGTESPVQKRAAVEAFTNGGSRVLIMSLQSGAGLDGLQEVCKTAVFGELDWSPKVHDQALGRLARDGQENEVLGYYLMANHGADPKIAEVLNLKHQQATPFENPYANPVAALPQQNDRMRGLAEDILRQHGIDPAALTATA